MLIKRYQLKPSREVPNAGTMGTMLRVGSPLPEHMANDICITTPGSYDFVPLNKAVLRAALLDDHEATKALLGIEVSDASADKKTIAKKTVAKKGE